MQIEAVIHSKRKIPLINFKMMSFVDVYMAKVNVVRSHKFRDS